MRDDSEKSQLRKTWEAAAPGWARWEHVVSAGLSGATETLLDMAGIGPGMRILDMACGAGSQTIQAARRVGPDGTVVASDISSTMLDHLRRNADEAGLRNVETLHCAADEIDAAQQPFDAAISRLGLMLFPAPRPAVEAARRALRPGGRFAAMVFTTPAANPFMARPMAILLRHAGKSPPGPGQPGIFALGGEDALDGVLRDGGLTGIETRTVTAFLEVPGTDEALEMMQQAFGAYRAVVADLDDDARAGAWDAVRDCIAQFETAGGFRAELEFVIGAGARPA